MNRTDLVKMVANQQADLVAEVLKASDGAAPHPRQVERLVSEIIGRFLESVTLALCCDEPVSIRDFGRFQVFLRQPQVKVNPTTGRVMDIPARVTVSFAPSDSLKERLNGGR